MFSSRHFAAPALCLRCQLRRAILGARARASTRHSPSPYPLSQFHTSAPLCQDGDHDVGLKDAPRIRASPMVSKHPLGRLVGKPGRRQLEKSERLKSANMQKPFEVIVMRDVPETSFTKPEARADATPEHGTAPVITAAEIHSEILNSEPEEKEVLQSIEALRPDTTSLDDSQHEKLVEKLVDGYNMSQLTSFLSSAMSASTAEPDPVEEEEPVEDRMVQSTWRPGRSPLTERPVLKAVVKKRDLGTGKSSIAKKIITLAWRLKVHAETQQIGELELGMERWQLEYLFDLSRNTKIMYQSMISPPLLLQSSEIQPYRPQNIVRITARKQDAEEIAVQIRRHFQLAGTSQFRLSAFRPLLGLDGRSEQLDKLFKEADLKYIGGLTATAIEIRPEDLLLIHGRTAYERDQAVRLLLALLDLPSQRTVSMCGSFYESSGSTPKRKKYIAVPQSSDPRTHLRHRGLQLLRLTAPAGRKTNIVKVGAHHAPETSSDGVDELSEGTQDVQIRDFAKTVVVHLAQTQAELKLRQQHQLSRSSYWSKKDLRPYPLEAQFCKVLLPASNPLVNEPAKLRPSSSAHEAVIKHQVPSLLPFLAFLKPDAGRVKSGKPDTEDSSEFMVKPPLLLVHMRPSPLDSRQTARFRLPRVEITYSFDPAAQADSTEGAPHVLRLDSMIAIVNEQEVRVPLPEEATDFRLLRRTPLIAMKDRLRTDPDIQKLTERLETSIRQRGGKLTAPLYVHIKLPAWLDNKSSRADIPVPYACVGFEQVQNINFVYDKGTTPLLKTSPEVKAALDAIPGNWSLRYTQVEGGVAEGKRTELTLRSSDKPTDGPSSHSSEPTDSGEAIASDRATDSSEATDVNEESADSESTESREPTADMETANVKDMFPMELQLVEKTLRLAKALTLVNKHESKATAMDFSNRERRN